MITRTFTRIGVAAALLLLAVSLASAQASPLPTPNATRGAFSPQTAFALPDGSTPDLTRAGGVTVTTTADRDNDTCDTSDLSLREALMYCAAGVSQYLTVFVPSGTYTLDGTIVIQGYNINLIGEDPFSTFIEGPALGQSNTLIQYSPVDGSLVLANLTLRNGIAQSSNSGGALAVIGYGNVLVTNSVFSGNQSGVHGGAANFTAVSNALNVTINHVDFSSNEAAFDGGAINFYSDSLQASNLHVQNSYFGANRAGAGSFGSGCRGGAINAYIERSGTGDAITIDNTMFDANFLICTDGTGGAVSIFVQNGDASVNVSDSAIVGNYALGEFSSGGGLYMHNTGGLLTVTGSIFSENLASYGGGLRDAASHSANIIDSTFNGNGANDGGGIYMSSEFGLSVLDSAFIANSANRDGGGLWLGNEPGYLGGVIIADNTAGDIEGLGGRGGGLFMAYFGAQIRDTLIEDNAAQFGPDCYQNSPASLVSFGGNGITDHSDCAYVNNITDQVPNMLLNGGFELGTGSQPDFWAVKNASGDKRVCDDLIDYGTTTPYGLCAYVFKGGADANTVLTQNVRLDYYMWYGGQQLGLYAMGDGVGPTNVQLMLKVSYTDPLLASGKTKLKFQGANPFYETSPFGDAFLTLESYDLAKLQVKITDKSTGGKFYLDRVYVYDISALQPFRSAEASALPLPVVPEGFRGGN